MKKVSDQVGSDIEKDDYLYDFLAFIEHDILTNPERLIPVADLREGVDELIKGLDVDLDEPLNDDDDI